MVVVSNVSGYIAIVHACIRMAFYCDVIIYHVNKTYTGSSQVVKGQKAVKRCLIVQINGIMEICL